MEKIHRNNSYRELTRSLSIDCKNCSGLCCVALYYAKTDGFPTNKEAGVKCENLLNDYQCKIHSELSTCNMKGCMAYDCFGAGQKVTQIMYPNEKWSTHPKLASDIFSVFIRVWQLHQMLWYLIEASSILCAESLYQSINELIRENEYITNLPPKKLLELNIDEYRLRVNIILKKVSGLVAEKATQKKKKDTTIDYMGKNLMKSNLIGMDFSMGLLIAANLTGCNLYAANFLGADLRDTNLRSADLSESIFLTQAQINSAQGNRGTKLPVGLVYPTSWSKA